MADLRAIAEAATPGPWVVADDCIVAGTQDRHGERTTLVYLIELARPTADAAHIAAWSPDRALAALDVIEAARLVANDLLLPFGNVLPSETRHPQELAAAIDRWDALP